jgi:trk system potassium uptake protein TrkA
VVAKDGFLVDEHVERVIIPHHDTVIEPDDHVIVFCTRKRQVTEVERLFQVAAGFI